MVKKTIEYTDYNGVERKEDFYFNLTTAEIAEIELSTPGGLSNTLEELVKKEDNAEMIKLFKMIILRSYGEKSEDGKRFIKSDELSTAFSQTEAYSNMFIELLSDADKASAFMNGLIASAPMKNAEDKNISVVAPQG